MSAAAPKATSPRPASIAVESFAAEVLSVRDSLDLARSVELDHGSDEAVQKMHEGIELTLKLMDSMLPSLVLPWSTRRARSSTRRAIRPSA